MNTPRSRLTTTLALCLCFLSTSACDGDDSNDEGLGEDGDSSSDTGSDTGDKDTGSGGESDDTSVDMDDGGDFGDTGELMGCALHPDAASCNAEIGCAAVLGSPVVADGAGSWCTLAEETFVGCASGSDLCPGTAKILCVGDQVWRTSACVPDNASVCEPPGEISGECG